MLSMLKNALLLLSLSGICRAEPAPTLPRWTEVNGMACYDLDGAKALKVFEVDAQACEDKLILSYERVHLLTDKVSIWENAVANCNAQKHALSSLVTTADKTIAALQADLKEEAAGSLRDGALVYTVLGAVVLIVASGVAGYEINSALH